MFQLTETRENAKCSVILLYAHNAIKDMKLPVDLINILKLLYAAKFQ